jgi:maleate isomerase
MIDSLGFRLKLGIIAPSTNTSVQPEMDAMRPHGVTNHFGRLYIPNDPIKNDDDFNKLMDNIRSTMEDAARVVMTCQPHRLVLGMSSETFWDGLEGSKRLNARMREVAGGVPVTTGAEAVRAALTKYGNIRRIAVITPYMPVGDAQVRRFFEDCGFEIIALKGLKCSSPVQIAHVNEKQLRDAIIEVNRFRSGRDCAGGHQPCHGSSRGHRRVLDRQAGDRNQHGDLLARTAREWCDRPCFGFWISSR